MMKLTQPFRGLQDFGKLQGQSNDVYDGSLANLRDVAAAGGGGGHRAWGAARCYRRGGKKIIACI